MTTDTSFAGFEIHFDMRKNWERQRGKGVSVFYSKNNHPLEQPPQECDRVPVAGDFQDAIG